MKILRGGTAALVFIGYDIVAPTYQGDADVGVDVRGMIAK